MKKNLIIIGKKSFIGSNIFKILKNKKKISIFTFKDFMKLSKKEIKNFKYICNCTVNKKNVYNKYNSKIDYDVKISKKIQNIDVNYIFLSSRKVYKPRINTSEEHQIKPIDIYARNKFIAEKILKKKLKSKLLILRISNVIGLKIFKNPRQVHATFFDNYLEMVRNERKHKFHNFYKDFISIEQLSKIFLLILNKKMNGIYNVSLGKKVSTKEMVNWLETYNKKKNQFFYKKTNKTIQKKHSFSLNNSKLQNEIKFRPKKTDLKKFCIKLSKTIHQSF